MEGDYQNNINSLPDLNVYRYEKIFKMYQTPENQYYYNLLQSIFLPENLDDSVIFYITTKKSEPWTMVSFNAYQTIELWWLILLINGIYNPFELPKTGTVLKLIKPEFIPTILKEINKILT